MLNSTVVGPLRSDTGNTVKLLILNLKVGSYDTYLRYCRVLTPQVITFDPEGVRA